MIDLIFIALFQASAAEPAQPPTIEPSEQNGATPLPGVAVPAPEAERANAERNMRTCRSTVVTGSRVRRERVCSSQTDEAHVREAFRHMTDTGTMGRGLGLGD